MSITVSLKSIIGSMFGSVFRNTLMTDMTTIENEANRVATIVNGLAVSYTVAWVSGTTYAIGDLRRSPIDYRIYKRITAGAGTTDPSADATNWILLLVEGVLGAPIASAATINLTNATGDTVPITGTTGINIVTLGAGLRRTVIFSGILLLTHNATTNNLPRGANITTAAGDRATYVSDGTTVYMASYVSGASNTEDTLTAFATGGQASALALSATKFYHRISVCATVADSVKLPAATAGQAHYIRNDGVAACQVFGTTPDTINGVATGTGVSLGAGVGGWFVCTTDAKWTTAGFGTLGEVVATKISASGLQTLAAGANIASAATVDLTAATGNTVHITGTVATSALTMNAGQQMILIADAAWPLTYNATTLNINTAGVNITLAAGDRLFVHKDNAGVVHGEILKANGRNPIAVNSTVRLDATNGWGSTNTKNRRFLTAQANTGTDITYADSATLGATFTINTTGVYAINYYDNFAGATFFGITLNGTTPTTDLTAIAAAERLVAAFTPAGNTAECVAITLPLVAGDVIRAHTNTTTAGTVISGFCITRVG